MSIAISLLIFLLGVFVGIVVAHMGIIGIEINERDPME